MPAKRITPRTGMLQLAKLVAGDLGSGRMSAGLQGVGLAVSESPEAGEILLDLLQAEARKKRPSGSLIDALLFMIGEALRAARMAIEADDHSPAAAFVAAVRDGLVAAAEGGHIPLDLLMALAQQFAAAKLDPGDALRAVAVTLTEQEAPETPIDPDELASQYAAMAASLDDDPFQIHDLLSDQLSVFPEAQRRVIIESLVFSDVPAMRDAAVGWLLDPSPPVSRHVAQSLATAAGQGLVSARSVGRLVLMRPWMPEAVQASLDAAIRACRQCGQMPVAQAAAQVGAIIASGCDGAGAQTFLVAIKRGRKLALASLLLKHGFGVRDAWVNVGLGKRELDQLMAQIEQELDSFDASPEIVEAAVAHGIAVGLGRDEPPPFALVHFLEAVGLTHIRPEPVEPEALISQLLAAVPAERQSAKAVAAALDASKRWPQHYAFPHSWFEPDEATQAVMRAGTRKREREAAVLADVLPARRVRWAELLAWTAQAARDQVEDDAWVAFALVARELLGDRPLTEIPAAVWIAKNTVAAAKPA